MTLLTTAYVAGTFFIVRYTSRAASEQRKTLEAMERPRLVVFLENDSERGAAVLVFKNAGRGVAQDVGVEARPPIENPTHPDLSFDDNKSLVQLGTPAMAPGYKLRSLIGTYGNWEAAPQPTPVIHVTYTDPATKRHYSDSFPIDMSPLFDMPDSRPKTAHSIAEELAKLNATLKKIDGPLAAVDTEPPSDT